MKWFLLNILVLLTHQTSSQQYVGRFLVNVAHYTLPNLSTANTRCVASIITDRHVLTTATCVIPQPLQGIAIQTYTASVNLTTPASRVSIHPNFVYTEEKVANVAVVMSQSVFSTEFKKLPVAIDGLQANTECRLFGEIGVSTNSRGDPVTILGSQSCNPSWLRIFCSTFSSEANVLCSTMLGSPVVCANNAIAGFLISDGSCSSVGSNVGLNYHSTSNYVEWLQEVVKEENSRFIVNVVQYPSGNIRDSTVRCSGTIITSHRVLTTASCVKVPSSMVIGIRTEMGTQIRTTNAERVFIHPDYRENNNGVANVAVIQAHLPFDPFFTPRSLGKLLPGSVCQLHGWSASSSETRRDAVAIIGPQSCDPSSPKLFCSNSFPFRDTCNARLGSAVICDNATISGILVNDGNCSSFNDNNLLSYHSIADYQEWIQDGSGGNKLISSFMTALIITWNAIRFM